MGIEKEDEMRQVYIENLGDKIADFKKLIVEEFDIRPSTADTIILFALNMAELVRSENEIVSSKKKQGH